ncbi:MAG: BamA/TamA family outer membrane protein [Proteobacteria bacterium]|nr:BamA/TamA family outer membrane protein [Pseudomonadota bacterium]
MNTPKGVSVASQTTTSYVTQWHGFEITTAMNALFDRSFKKPEAPDQTTQFIYPSLVLLRTSTDNLTDNHRGYMIKWVIQGAAKNILSTQTFWQTRLDGKAMYPLNRNNRIVTRGTFGYTGTSNVATLPIALQFLTGGSQSIRGYTYQSLGPGRFLVVASAEYERRIYGKWFGAVFFDMGNSVNSLGGTTPFFTQMKKSVGVGILRETPVGPIQLSVAKALDSPGQPISLVFNFGPEL